MDFELRRAREKLQKEQKERKDRAKLKVAREKKAKEEASRNREALEAVQRARRIDAAQAQIKVLFFPCSKLEFNHPTNTIILIFIDHNSD